MGGQIKSYDDLSETDLRKRLPRFQPGNFEINLKLVAELEKMAKRKNCTPAQLALGWLISLSKKEGMPVIIPIPGTTIVERVRENAAAVELSAEEMKEIDSILATFQVSGDRYHEFGMKYVNT